MSIEILLFRSSLYIEFPQGLAGWLGWLAVCVILAILFLRWKDIREIEQGRTYWMMLGGLALLVPLTSLFILLRLPPGDALPPPGIPVDPTGPALMIFTALPWVLAAGLLGTAPSILFAFLSGLALALWDTHSPFTPFEFALLALLLCAMVNQRYRTFMFTAFRHPLGSAALLSAVYPLLFLIDTLFLVGGTLAGRLDYGFTHAGYTSLAVAGPLLFAGVFAEVVANAAPAWWGKQGPLLPAPSERKLEFRFYYNIAPIAFLLLIVLMAGDWVVAGNSARQMLRERMSSTAKTASETVPFFLEAGQSLIQQLAGDPRLYTQSSSQISDVLSQDLRSVPFFRQLFLLDEQGHSVTGFPLARYENSIPSPPPEEMMGIELALKGVPIQDYTIPQAEGETAAQVSFLAAVTDESGAVRRVLIGRSDLSSNPFTQPVLAGIRDIVGADGEGMLLDSKGRILYHPNPSHLMETYTGRMGDQVIFYDETAPDGTRRLVYYQPVLGHPWSIVLSVPARRAQQLALNIAIPLLGMVLVLFAFAVILLRFGLRVVTGSLENLGIEARRIASGQLDHPLPVEGEDEVGQLRRTFEQMRVSLKSRLDELNRLLLVSQGVASSLEIKEAVQPVLEAALSIGGCSARVVLTPSVLPAVDEDNSHPSRFGLGAFSDLYSALDEQILDLTRKQERLVLQNLTRVRLLNITPGTPRPEALLALALRHESLYYGALWIAFDRPHQFNDDEVRFLVTLAGQAALAAANTRLFQSAEIGRQRLAAILASTPDPVLVTDQHNRLLLSNPAAWQVLGLGMDTGEAQLIEQLTTYKDLVRLLRPNSDEKQSAEITLVNGRVYLATASSILTDGQRMGRVCVLRDITRFKELDALKSEFVSTVSHDLRSPLTLMHGYSTMLEMVGELNEQQTGYVRKIVNAVESMSRLVNNLLDLGRIEAGVDLQLEMVLVHDIVERVTGALQLQATQKRIQLTTDIPVQTIPLIDADPALLQQALHNLVDNAIKYTDAGGKVNVSVSVREEGMVFQVSDTGIGVAPVDQARLFEKFYRGAQRDAKKQHGTGLGLAIVKSIAERHGGRVWMESQLGKGSTFYLLIPLRQARLEVKPAKISV